MTKDSVKVEGGLFKWAQYINQMRFERPMGNELIYQAARMLAGLVLSLVTMMEVAALCFQLMQRLVRDR